MSFLGKKHSPPSPDVHPLQQSPPRTGAFFEIRNKRQQTICAELRTSALNMTLPALLQSACTAYTSCRSGAHAQQQTSCTPLLPSIDGTDRRTDGRTRAYYASSVNNKGYVLGGRCPGAVVHGAVVRETIVRGGECPDTRCRRCGRSVRQSTQEPAVQY